MFMYISSSRYDILLLTFHVERGYESQYDTYGCQLGYRCVRFIVVRTEDLTKTYSDHPSLRTSIIDSEEVFAWDCVHAQLTLDVSPHFVLNETIMLSINSRLPEIDIFRSSSILKRNMCHSH